MEAPEKFYTDGNGLFPTSQRHCDSDIEYVRTDAFIEKAVSYLNSKLYDFVQTTNPNQRSYANTIMKQDFIEDFINYMKGE